MLSTPAGQLTERLVPLAGVDPDPLAPDLRRALVPQDDDDQERRDQALQRWRELFLPRGLGSSRATQSRGKLLALNLDAALDHLPWELVLTEDGTEPLGCAQGLVRQMFEPAAALKPASSAAPLHALVVSGTRPQADLLESVKSLHDAQAAAAAQWLRAPGSVRQGRLDLVQRSPAADLVSALHADRWRIVVLVGDSSRDRLLIDHDVGITPGDFQQLASLPALVVLIGDDFRALGSALRRLGVAVVVAAGWPMATFCVQVFSWSSCAP